jgi:hypothetical protein
MVKIGLEDRPLKASKED